MKLKTAKLPWQCSFNRSSMVRMSTVNNPYNLQSSDKRFPPRMLSMEINVPNSEVLGLRKGRKYQIEQSTLIGPIQIRKAVHLESWIPIFSRFYRTDLFDFRQKFPEILVDRSCPCTVFSEHENVRCSKKSTHTWQHTWPIGNGTRLKADL